MEDIKTLLHRRIEEVRKAKIEEKDINKRQQNTIDAHIKVNLETIATNLGNEGHHKIPEHLLDDFKYQVAYVKEKYNLKVYEGMFGSGYYLKRFPPTTSDESMDDK